MSYESYKLVHLTAIFLFLSGASVMLIGRESGRIWKILTGIASLLILIAGMGALAKLQSGGFPAWVQAKIVIWLMITSLGHVVAKRFPKHGTKAYLFTLALAIVAAALAIFKPV